MLSRMLSSAVAVPRMCESNKKLLRKRATFVGLLCGRMANSTFTATVTPPHRLLRPLHINEKKLFGPGPSNMPPLVQEGLVQPLLGHMHPEFFEIMDDVKAGIKYIFQTENALTFAVSGTGHAGMECAILNLLEPGQTILVVQNGVWGLRAANLAERLGIKVHRLVVPEGEVINLDDFAEAVDNYRPQVAFVCHGESSTGVVHPLERFGDICNAYDVLFMIVQGMWDRDSPLKQIPHFSPEVVKVANEFGIKDIFDFMEAMNPDENADYNKLVKRLGLSQNQLAQAANFTNDKYPDLELEHEVLDEGEIRAGEPAYLNIKIARNLEEEDGDYDSTVHAPFYPSKKMENWWLVVGDEKTKSLLAIKRVTIGRELNVRLEYTVPSPGEHDLKLFLMSDSYVGVDQEREFSVTAAEGMDVDDDEEDEDEDEDEE